MLTDRNQSLENYGLEKRYKCLYNGALKLLHTMCWDII